MTTTQELAGVEAMQTLLQRLESLTAPSREVSDELLLSWGWTRCNWHEETWHPPGNESFKVRERPHPTASIDDALLGVPDGNYWVEVCEPHSWTDRPKGMPGNSAYFIDKFWNAARWCFTGGPGGNPKKWEWWEARCDLGTTEKIHRFMGHSEGGPAIALCIAIVKARGGV